MKRLLFISVLFSLTFIGCKQYYAEDDFSSVLKVDSHIHIYSDDGVFEDQATADNFILITLGVDHGDFELLETQLDFAVRTVQKHPGRVFYGPTFVFDTAGWGSLDWTLNTMTDVSNGLIDGGITVKIWKNIGMTVRNRNGKFIMVDDPGMHDLFLYLSQEKIPVTGHLGEPRNCWLPLDQMTVSSDSSYFASHPQYHMFLHPEYPSYEDQIKARDNFLEKHPDLTFIGCHLGSLEWNVDSLALRLDRYPNMAVDMSARICHLQYQSAKDRDGVRNFIIRYQDRLLYGTDVVYSGSSNPDGFKESMHETWIDDWKYFTSESEMTSELFRGTFTGLKLPKSVINKIYSENAIKWYKLKI